MCERFSWIEKDGEILFLTPYDVFETKRGKQLQKHTPAREDWYGHGATRWFFHNLKGGVERECTDFSTPKNFPVELAKAIKDGRMLGFGITEQMLVMLRKPALAEYQKVTNPALAEYQKVRQQALAEYQKVTNPALAEYQKVRQQAWAEYQKVGQQVLAEYQKVGQQAWAEYQKVGQQAWAEYQKVGQQTWAKLFKKKSNRIKAWQ